jgi:hypothetical protein
MNKLVLALGSLALASPLALGSLSAQQQTPREDAVRTCVSEAQANTPNITDANDPRVAARYSVYSDCMRRLGHNP